MSNHRPVLIVIAGPNGSGKTSITQKILHHEWLEDSVYINPDNIARDVFGDWNDQTSVLQAANYCKEWRERCLMEGMNHIFETVMSAPDKVDYIMRAKKLGFFIRLFFVSTSSPTINAKRVAQRVLSGGHDVPISKIISRYEKSIANCTVLAPYVDRLYIYDNSIDDADAQLLFRFTDGAIAKQYKQDLPSWSIPIFNRHK
ncbi:MAG: zeta toxin family protein [Bacteroidales bacterium]|nr:zeta toxin family protein [Bacteroidales bacterium]